MRTNIVIDDDLLAEAMRLSGAATKKAAVAPMHEHLGLRRTALPR